MVLYIGCKNTLKLRQNDSAIYVGAPLNSSFHKDFGAIVVLCIVLYCIVLHYKNLSFPSVQTQ